MGALIEHPALNAPFRDNGGGAYLERVHPSPFPSRSRPPPFRHKPIAGHHDGIMDRCIVLVHVPLPRLEEFWPITTKSETLCNLNEYLCVHLLHCVFVVSIDTRRSSYRQVRTFSTRSGDLTSRSLFRTSHRPSPHPCRP